MTAPTAIIIFTVHSNDGFIEEGHNNRFKVDGDSGTVVTDTWLNLSESTTTVGTEEQTPAPPVLSFLRITTAYKPKSHGVFVFGRDPDKCDILLSDNQHSGISRRQFAIQVNFNSAALVIKDYSRNGTKLTSRNLGTLVLKNAQRAIPPNEDVQVVAGRLVITIRPPVHTPESWAPWAQYCAQFASQPPPIEVLNIESEATTSAKTLGYDLGRKLGSGTSATVYSAIHGLTGNAVAVKQYHTADVRRHNDRDVLDIRHPHIVGYLYYVAWPDKPPTLITELVNGPNLAREHEERALTTPESRVVLWQLGDAVSYLHDKKHVTHRDIKPANVLVQSRSPVHVKLADFDLASKLSDLDGNCGTPFYAAPEITSSTSYTNKVDIWSLGILALELLFGLPRYPGSRRAWLETVEGYVIRLPSSPARDFISNLLQRKPMRRLAAADALKHEFFTADLYDYRDPAPAASTRARHATRSSRPGGQPASATGESLQDTLPWGVFPERLQDTELWQNLAGEAAAYAHDLAATQLRIGGDNASAAAITAAPARGSSTHLARSPRQRGSRLVSAAGGGLQDTQPWGLEATALWQNDDPSATVRQIATSAWLRQSGDPLNPEVGAAPAAIPGSHELVSNPEAVPEEDTAAPRPSSYNAGGQTAGSLGTDPCQITPQFASPPPLQTYWLAQHGTSSADARAEEDGSAVAEDEAVVFRPSSYSADGQAVESLAADTCPSGLSRAPGIEDWAGDAGGLGSYAFVAAAWPTLYPINSGFDGGFDGGFVDPVNAPNGDGDGDDNQYPGRATPMASHLSTRSVTEADGQVYVVIKRQRVSIRTSDCYFNASEILIAAGESRYNRDRILRQIRGIAQKDRSRVWVPFSIGVRLCRTLGLDADIQGLLKFGPPAFPKKGGNHQEGEEGDGGERESPHIRALAAGTEIIDHTKAQSAAADAQVKDARTGSSVAAENQSPQRGADGKFQCTHCSKTYRRAGCFEKHLLLHGTSPQRAQKGADGKFQCTHCSKTYRRAGCFEKHLLLHGTGSYLCAFCRDKFSREDEWERHFRKCPRPAKKQVKKPADGS
ncbi:hypothetical protein RB597_008510 [Gaeumannomyces tritici]